MTERQMDVDDLLGDLRQALNASPSPHFENRVRAHVLDQAQLSPAPLFRRNDRVLVSLCAIAVATVASVVVISRASLFDASSDIPQVTSITTLPSPAVATDAAVAPTEWSPRSGWSPRSLDRGIAMSASATGFEVLVPPDQRIALQRLLAAVAAGNVDVPARQVAVDRETGELLPPPPIEIAPLPDIRPLEPINSGARREK